MPSAFDAYPTMVAALADFDGPPRPSRGDRPPFEAALAQALARGGSSKRADAALRVLAEAGLLDPRRLDEVESGEIRDILREGRVELPARTIPLLKRLAGWFARQGEDADFLERSRDDIREELRSIHGVGPALADAILLALGHAAAPVDRGAYRILVRHGWIDAAGGYDEAGELLSRLAGGAPAEIARFSERLRRVARQFCTPRTARCADCPLRGVLPEGGPIEPEA